MAKGKIVLSAILVMLILSVGCPAQENKKAQSERYEREKLEEKIKILNEKIEEQTTQMNYINDELAAYKKFVAKIDFESLDQKMIKEFAKSEWEYKLRIEGKDCPTNGEIEIEKDTLKVELVQRMAEFTALPNVLFDKGAISGYFSEHLKVISSQPYKVEGSSGTIVEAVIYEFNGLTKDSVVVLNITEELQERLGLKTRDIKIRVK